MSRAYRPKNLPHSSQYTERVPEDGSVLSGASCVAVWVSVSSRARLCRGVVATMVRRVEMVDFSNEAEVPLSRSRATLIMD